jgi:hypothetical protein
MTEAPNPEPMPNHSYEFRQSAFRLIEEEVEAAQSELKRRTQRHFQALMARNYSEFAECLVSGQKEVHLCQGAMEQSDASKQLAAFEKSLKEAKRKAEEKSWKCFSGIYTSFMEKPEKMNREIMMNGMGGCAKMISEELKMVSF